jgi:hypothetical protein
MNLALEDRLRLEPGVEETHMSPEDRPDGRRVRNTEIFGFDGNKISRVEVYFGWDVEGSGR